MSDIPKSEQILEALKTLFGSDPFFPPASVAEPEPKNMRADVPGATSSVRDHLVLQCDEAPEITRDGGAENSWELEGRYSAVYAVLGGDVRERRSRRAQAVAHAAALIAGRRDLGLQDPQIYAELGPAERGDEVAVKGVPGFALILIPINVQYVAQSAAG